MVCPVCHPATLRPIELEANLQAARCERCEGVYLGAAEYREWLARGVSAVAGAEAAPAEDVPAAKRCPRCGHLLLRYRVAPGLAITLDHCDACNGVWCDRGEWEALKRHDLHDDLTHVFTAPWQRRLREAEHRAAVQAIYAEKLGEADYAELRRVRAWLAEHPQQALMRAYLNAEDPYGR